MPLITWEDMLQQHPAAHLVVGAITEDASQAGSVDYGGVKRHVKLLARLASTLALLRPYALTIIRQRDGAHIHVALADRADAAKLSRAVGACARVGRYPGWGSQSSFRFDGEAARNIAAALKNYTPPPVMANAAPISAIPDQARARPARSLTKAICSSW